MTNRIASRRYIDGSRDQACTLRIAGVCTGGGDDTVFAHIRDSHTGRSIKASDTSGADACASCHRVFDRQARMPQGNLLSNEDWYFYALRGLQETMEHRIAQGILVLPFDAEKPSAEKTTPPRKPKAERQQIQTRGFQQGHRPMQSKPFPQRAKTK